MWITLTELINYSGTTNRATEFKKFESITTKNIKRIDQNGKFMVTFISFSNKAVK